MPTDDEHYCNMFGFFTCLPRVQDQVKIFCSIIRVMGITPGNDDLLPHTCYQRICHLFTMENYFKSVIKISLGIYNFSSSANARVSFILTGILIFVAT